MQFSVFIDYNYLVLFDPNWSQKIRYPVQFDIQYIPKKNATTAGDKYRYRQCKYRPVPVFTGSRNTGRYR